MRNERMLALAAAAEETSSHPLATAILNEIKNRGIAIPKHQECIIKVARGIETAVNKSIIRVGSQKYMEENNIDSEKVSDIFAYFYFLTSCAASTGAFRIACALFFPIISTSSH